MREAEIEMREAGQFHSLSFCVFALRGSQPGKKKKLTWWRVETRTLESAMRSRGTGTRAKFERAEWRKIRRRNKERAERSVNPSFPRIPLIYILSWHR